MVEITDHAIVRFLERVKGIDMDTVRAEMTNPRDRDRHVVRLPGRDPVGRVSGDRAGWAGSDCAAAAAGGREVTPKQQAFVEQYLVDLNATQAAIRAGYAAGSADVTGCRLLGNAKVAAAIAQSRKEQAGKLGLSAEKVLRELALIGFCNMQDYLTIVGGDPVIDLSGMTRDQAAAVLEVTVEDFKDGRGEDARDVRRVKFKLADKRAALVDLGRHLKLFTDKVETSGNIAIAISSEDAQA